MRTADRRWLLEQILATAELLGQEMTARTAAVFADDLAGYPQDVLAKALARVRAEHRGRLTPSAVLERIDEVAGRPSASEAWAMAVGALDERNTVVWTVEMRDAWGVVNDLAERGDLIGARMGFIQAYDRLVRIARDERALPQVEISEGWDKEAKALAITKAIELGYVDPARHSAELLRVGFDGVLPCPTGTVQISYKGGLPVKVEEVAVQKGFHPAVAARFAAARQVLAEKPEQQRLRREQEERERQALLQQAKEETQRRVDEYKEQK